MVSRRRSYMLRILVLIPAIWFLSVLIFTFDGGFSTDSKSVRSQDDLSANRVSIDETKDNKQVKVIQGFGPPMSFDRPVEAETEPPVTDSATIKLSVSHQAKRGGLKIVGSKYVIDWNSTIYKHEPNQPGENGKPVVVNKNSLSPEQQKEFDEGWTNNAFNQYASDMISVHRSAPVAADQSCFNDTYDSDLPDTSVVICFHNEAWSVLLRTVHSVLEQSPPHLIKDIILVDDFSDQAHLQEPLDEYFSQISKVKILRLKSREGLIRARLKGFEIAKGKVVTFLDSHVECTRGWLEPLLARIKIDPKTVVCPVIDVIDESTMEFHFGKAHHTQIGGFDWGLQFTWHSIPERMRKDRKRVIDPIASPTMAGGLFSIDRAYFEHLGTYDPGFDIWGGENLELSFKIWMCGGRLEIVPCSHVGHIFRKRSPYKWRTGVNVLRRNTVRLAEVWLDDYKQYYYERINNQLGEYGNVSDRLALRKSLNCSSFKWYLDNIYPELFVPGDSIASGELRNKGGGAKMCLDWGRLKGGKYQGPRVGLYWCHDLGGNQFWSYTSTGEIRRDESCLDYAGQEVLIYSCHGSKGNQEWRYDHNKSQLHHLVSDKCLEMTADGARLQMKPCDPSSVFQQWSFKNYDEAKARRAGLLDKPV